jgi:hypothetical protein
MTCNTVDTTNGYNRNQNLYTYNEKQKNPEYFTAGNHSLYFVFYQTFKYIEAKKQTISHWYEKD